MSSMSRAASERIRVIEGKEAVPVVPCLEIEIDESEGAKSRVE